MWRRAVGMLLNPGDEPGKVSRADIWMPFNYPLGWYPTPVKAKLSRRTMYQTRYTCASNALAAGEAPSWVSAMLGHASPEMLFSVYARFIPNRTRQDGSALVSRMDGAEERRGERKEG